jgi:iron(III) transport system substrate-binding protein
MKKSILSTFLIIILSACGGEATENQVVDISKSSSTNEVNIYSARKGYLLKPLLVEFEKDTNIKVNIISGKSKALQKRIEQEGQNTRADVLLTVDAGNLYKAKYDGLLQSINSEKLNKLIPSHLRDIDGYWYGLSIRSRVIMYNPKKVNVNELSTYEDLANPKWKGRICIRSSSNIYNQSLLASLVSHLGVNKAEDWARKVVENFSRKPKGNDRTQMTSVVLEECDITLANTYYLGKWITSEKKDERKYAKMIAVFFPNQINRGAHINISGAAIVKYSKNTDNALKLIEYLASKKAQELYAKANHEYPIRENIEVSDTVKSWGYPFKQDTLSLNKLGKNNKKAVEIFDKVNWQ